MRGLGLVAIFSLQALAVLANNSVDANEAAQWSDGNENADTGFVVFKNVTMEEFETGDFDRHLASPAVALVEADLEIADNDSDGADGLITRAGEKTNVRLGRNRIEYGCDASIRKTLGDAINSLCSNGGCDVNRYYTRKVDVVQNLLDGGSAVFKKSIRVDAWSNYDGKDTRGRLVDITTASVNPTSAVSKNKVWSYWVSTGEGFGFYNHGTCKMSMFADYIQVTRRNSAGGITDTLELRISWLQQDKSVWCKAAPIEKAIASVINRPAAAFFGVIKAICNL